VRAGRKHLVLAKRADTLPKSLAALGVSDANAYKVVENTAHDARRLGLAIYGGHIGTAFRVEWDIMRAYPEQWRLARLPVKAVMLLLALTLPPKLFYRVRRRYSMLGKRN
jgi:hypothetical protein